MFPKRGNVFPDGSDEDRSGLDYRRVVAEALRNELGGTHQAVKTVMRWTGASERTAKNWIAGSHGPSGEHLVTLMRHSDEVMTRLFVMAGRREAVIGFHLIQTRGRLEEIRQMIDAILKGGAD